MRHINISCGLGVMLAVGLLLCAGCKSDFPVVPECPECPGINIGISDSPDRLMSNFRTVFESMDFDNYETLLAPGYLMLLQSRTSDLYPDVGSAMDLAADLRCTERMFAGVPLTDPEGNRVPGISTIQFSQLEQQGVWATSPSDDVIPNTKFGLFEIVFQFERPGTSTLMVAGQIKFYVTERDTVNNGVATTTWQLAGQQDLTRGGYDKPNEEYSWGTIKAMYR